MSWWPVVSAVIFPNLGGLVGTYFTRKSIPDWYNKQLVKPSWRPPNWVFGPVWTYLYCSMGYSSYRVWDQLGRPDVINPFLLPQPLLLFLIQILLNWLWTPIFFGMKHITFALLEIVVLYGAVVVTTLKFFELDQVSGLLLLPYVAWLTLATCLTAAIWKANPCWRFGTSNKTK